MFNLALLGKHGWRFMTHPDSLCSQVLKGRYFQNSDFLQVTAPNRCSATWRAIVAGKEVLKMGLIKRIGDGTSILVWHDSWIPGIQSMKPSAQLGDEDHRDNINLVSDLFDHETGSWKIAMVRKNFISIKVDAILNIPLRRQGGEDFWAWSLEKMGVYTVKSAYHALMSRNEQAALDEGAMTESSNSEKQLWTTLWKLRVMPKVRVFWWRVLRDILPAEATLKHRHIVPIGRCKICLAANEDIMHTLQCVHARKFWVEAQS
jgi:hypothetical protein